MFPCTTVYREEFGKGSKLYFQFMSLKERINLGVRSQTRKCIRKKAITCKDCQTAGGQEGIKVAPVHQGAAQGMESSISVTPHLPRSMQGIAIKSACEQVN